MDTNTHAQIIDILDRAPDMSLATLRSDGFPQATVVSYVHDDLTLYFMTVAGTQKAVNLAACDMVSGTITPPYKSWNEIEGLSFAGHAASVTDPQEIHRVSELMMQRFPEIADFDAPGDAKPVTFRIDAIVFSILDYAKGFGHTDLVEAQPRLA